MRRILINLSVTVILVNAFWVNWGIFWWFHHSNRFA